MPAHHATTAAFLPIEQHGLIGDRRTGALVAADGTVNWFCAPEFDGEPIFGALLDGERGGFCRFAPRPGALGRQSYLPGTAVLITCWTPPANGGEIELADVMAWPDNARSQETQTQRIIIRRMRALEAAEVLFALKPRRNFKAATGSARPVGNGLVFPFGDGELGLWTSFACALQPDGTVAANVSLRAGEEHWAVIGWNLGPAEWSAAAATAVFEDATNYWRTWSGGLRVEQGGERTAAIRRSAITVQLLSHAEHNSAVAALTTSLPERIGGDRNYDYRYAWVRDASLSLSLLACLGQTDQVKSYLHWLAGLSSDTASPLQVCYRLNGDPQIGQREIPDISAYRDSRPALWGNRAAKQKQLGSLGFFADCARIYIDEGGEWQEEFWRLLQRAAAFTCENWQGQDSGVWELEYQADYVASRVMSWVVLEQAVYIAEKTGHGDETGHWRQTSAQIHAEVMAKGWSEEKNSFRQRYGSDALDAAALLIPLMGFLPVDHPRVRGTLAALERELVINGLIHRFNPVNLPGAASIPLGEFEGAFLPCVFWHAHVLAQAGRCDEAEAILARCEAIAGETGLFAEEAHARDHCFLGNTPLLFSHVEYVRAAVELNRARARAGAADSAGI
jgi:GH15 family glucan-1,4-alpha-glucosidase